MKRVFILLALFVLMHSEKNDPVQANTLNKPSAINAHLVCNRHKPYGSDVWPGMINVE